MNRNLSTCVLLLPSLAALLPAQAPLFRLYEGAVPVSIRSLCGDVDLDADGVPDLQVAGTSTPSGPAMTVLSGRRGTPLLSTPFTGEVPLQFVDLNGDGIMECITSTGFYSFGTVRVRAGGPTGAVLFQLPPPTGSSSAFGFTVVVIGDLDGDGTRDLAIPSPTDAVVVNGALIPGIGRVYLHSGATGALLAVAAPADLITDFGVDVVGVPDADGDLVPDVIVGASGAVFLCSGSDGALLREYGARDAAARFGTALDDAGDLDGDGAHDLIVGAPGASTPNLAGGTVYVFSGATGARLHALHGAVHDELGTSVAGAGDFDGDGVADLLAGAIQRGITGAAGCVRAFSGRTGALLFTVPGDAAGDRFGTRVLGLPDVNGDGVPDLAATRSEWPNWQAPSVVLQVVSGAPLVLATDRHTVEAATGGAQALAIDAGAARAGQVYLVLGSASGVAPGFALHGVDVPLNADFWTAATLGNANGPLLVDTLGALDAQGRATATLVVPPLPALQGLALDHAAVFVAGAQLVGASAAAPLTLQ